MHEICCAHCVLLYAWRRAEAQTMANAKAMAEAKATTMQGHKGKARKAIGDATQAKATVDGKGSSQKGDRHRRGQMQRQKGNRRSRTGSEQVTAKAAGHDKCKMTGRATAKTSAFQKGNRRH